MKNENKNVTYCEWLAFGNPIERQMPYAQAKKRYDNKQKAIQGYVFKDSCFIGIKNQKGEWLIKN